MYVYVCVCMYDGWMDVCIHTLCVVCMCVVFMYVCMDVCVCVCVCCYNIYTNNDKVGFLISAHNQSL